MRSTLVRSALAVIAIAVLSMLLASCIDFGYGPPPPPQPSSAVIGPAGGTITSPDGIVTLTVPPGAVGSDVTFGVAIGTRGPNGIVGVPYDLTPSTPSFATPAVLRVDLTYAYLAPSTTGADLAIVHQVGGSWQALATTYDSASDTVSAELTDLGTYAVVAP